MKVTRQKNNKEFAAPLSQDFTIKDSTGVIGHLRVKPSGIAWKGKGQQTYYNVTIDAFSEFATKYGKASK